MNGNALDHFRLRASSWAMATINAAVGGVMALNPDVLTSNPGANVYFSHLVTWVSPDLWRNIFLAMGLVRLAALYINGTYPSIWWTPHLRLCMAMLSFIVWVQFAISIVAAGILTIGTVLYCGVVCVEAFNIAVAASETKTRPEGEFG